VASTRPFFNGGQLKALAVTTPKRLPALGDVPPVIEAGVPNFEVTNWHGLVAPTGLPRDIQMKLNKAVNDSLQGPGMEQGMAQDGLTASGGTPEEFGSLLATEVARWGALAKKRGIRAD
jgi:tripartite-type tricarboxylate transporter receptor subunit TctC